VGVVIPASFDVQLLCSVPSKKINVAGGQRLVCSIKVEVKKKHISLGWNFACFAAHVMEQDLL
jgi:hypothetical protein